MQSSFLVILTVGNLLSIAFAIGMSFWARRCIRSQVNVLGEQNRSFLQIPSLFIGQISYAVTVIALIILSYVFYL